MNIVDITPEMMKKYGDARFTAGFYTVLNLLNDEIKEREILKDYKNLIEFNSNDGAGLVK